MAREGVAIYIDRVKADRQASLVDELAKIGHGRSILEYHRPSVVVQALFGANDGDSKKARRPVVLAQELDAIASLGGGIEGAPQAIRVLAGMAPKIGKEIARSLLHQGLAGYYHLEEIEPGGGRDGGFVILLRQPVSAPFHLIAAVSRGCDSATYERLCRLNAANRGHLTFAHVAMPSPLGQLRSPDIEHLLQAFAQLYARIGLEDPSEGALAHLVGHILQGAKA